MNRIFGRKKEVVDPKEALKESEKNSQAQIAVYNGRITQLNNQLVELRTKLNKLRPGTAGYDTVKRRALQVLQQKRMYEQQRDKIQDQLFSVEQARFQSQALQDTVSQMKTMRDTHKLIKKEFKASGLNVDNIYKLQEEMAEFREFSDEVQEVLSNSYDLPDEIDEMELMGELEALELELADEGVQEAPSYLEEEPAALPDIPTEAVETEADELEKNEAKEAA